MATRVKVELLRPLNGEEIGATAEYDQADADRLAATGAVKILGKAEATAPENKAEVTAPANKSVARKTNAAK